MCCPAGATAATDPDCSATCGNGVLEPGRDPATPPLPAGAPERLPGVASCDDQDPCTRDDLISAGTCAAVCVHRPIRAAIPGDGCCPVNAVSRQRLATARRSAATGRTDPGEACDRGASRASRPGGCPEMCEPRRRRRLHRCDTLSGSGCQAQCVSHAHRALGGAATAAARPASAAASDSDCPAVCGNGAVEPGEACDKAIPPGSPGACPTTCPTRPATSCLAVRLDGTRRRLHGPLQPRTSTAAAPPADGCCPQGCTSAPIPTARRHLRQRRCRCRRDLRHRHRRRRAGRLPHRRCADSRRSAPPISCSRPAPASARCASAPITHLRGRRRLLPAGRAQPARRRLPRRLRQPGGGEPAGDLRQGPARPARPAPAPSAAPAARGLLASMPSGGRPRPAPPAACSRRSAPASPATAAARSGCTRGSDERLPLGLRQRPCSKRARAATWASPRASPAPARFLCDDGDACTTDLTLGRRIDCTRTCRHTPALRLAARATAAARGCTPELDPDCRRPSAATASVEAGETCDPPSSCPTAAPTTATPAPSSRLVGDAKACTARCDRTAASPPARARTADRCCPTGCVVSTDVDCGVPPPQPRPSDSNARRPQVTDGSRWAARGAA